MLGVDLWAVTVDTVHTHKVTVGQGKGWRVSNRLADALHFFCGRHTQVLELFAGGVHGGIEPALDRDL